MLRWQVGEYVVYPGFGVAVIVAVEQNELFGAGTLVYVLEVLQNSRRVMMAADKAECGAVREIVSENEALQILASLKEPVMVNKSIIWQKRQKILNSKLSSRQLQDVADVVREIYYAKGSKNFSFSQRQLFDNGIALISQELSVSLGLSMADICNRIRAVLV